MSETVAVAGVTKEKGFLYFIDKDGDVARSKMKSFGGKKGAEKVALTNVKKEKGYLYFLDKQGNVGRAAMKHGGKA